MSSYVILCNYVIICSVLLDLSLTTITMCSSTMCNKAESDYYDHHSCYHLIYIPNFPKISNNRSAFDTRLLKKTVDQY